jgi:hypothetical protein
MSIKFQITKFTLKSHLSKIQHQNIWYNSIKIIIILSLVKIFLNIRIIFIEDFEFDTYS